MIFLTAQKSKAEFNVTIINSIIEWILNILRKRNENKAINLKKKVKKQANGWDAAARLLGRRVFK